ncbi:hypothetical protein EHP00_408 [Ecytonucleospora hepatopenaei]|uniref:Uncharacterized protein n=1 Tax=Ecytonucleospora hepatopenaei TaxID=646526 RepID=A0A1W0E9G0_9MICR|nr:hypothetical protein EHP00_408 [Ecytonucleospora hepatopenaei]
MSVAQSLMLTNTDAGYKKESVIQKFKNLPKTEKNKRYTNAFVMLVIFAVQDAVSSTVLKHEKASKYLVFIHMTISLIAYFYKKSYLAGAQAGILTNGLFALALATYVIEYKWNPLISHICTPVLSVLFILAFALIPSKAIFIQVIASLNTFYQVGKYATKGKWYVVFSLLGVYAILQLVLYLKNKNLSIYISRIFNLFQMTSLTLEMTLNAFNAQAPNKKTMLFTNILFGISMICVSLLRVPKIKKANSSTEEKEFENQGLDINNEYEEAKFSSDLRDAKSENKYINDIENTNSVVGESAFSTHIPDNVSTRGWKETPKEEPVNISNDFTPKEDSVKNDELTEEGFYNMLKGKMVH